MKAISLWQPWASLVIDGRKRIETRSWKAPGFLIGQQLAIYATKRVDVDFAAECGYGATIPRGAILGVVLLTGCERFTEGFSRAIAVDVEARYGDFTPGRWGWFLTVIEKFPHPYEQRQARVLFDWEFPKKAESA